MAARIDFRSGLTSALRRAARVLPVDSAFRQRLSRCWDGVLKSMARYVTVPVAGRAVQLQVGLHHLDPNYEAEGLRIWLALIRPGDTVWDVGANIGIYTLLAGQQTGPDGRVVAWEPGPATHDILQGHIAANGLSDRVRVIQAAIADQDGGVVQFSVSSATEPDSTNRIGKKSDGGTIDVPVGTLDGWLDRLGSPPRLLKIDIEGAELLALRGAARLLGPGGPRPAMLLAVHPMFLPEFGCAPHEIAELLAEYGYDCRDLHGNPSPPTEYAEYLCVPSERSAEFAFVFDKGNNA